MVCPHCNSTHNKVFFSRLIPVYPFTVSSETAVSMPSELEKIITLNYLYCPECGLVYSHLSPEDHQLLDIIYEKYYFYISRTDIIDYELESFLTKTSQWIAQRETVAEIGCYDGSLLALIRSHYSIPDLIGIEPSIQGGETARKRGFEIITDFFPTPKLHKKCDTIISRHVIEHITNIKAFLEAQFEAVKPGGIVICETPNVDWALIHGSDKPFHFQHVTLLTKQYFLTLLRQMNIGFVSIIELDYRIIIAASQTRHENMIPLEEAQDDRETFISALPSFQNRVDTHFLRVQNLLEQMEGSVAVWGAGSFAGNILANLPKNLLTKIDGIIDSDQAKAGYRFLFWNKPVTTPESLAEQKFSSILIMSTYEKEIFEVIRQIAPPQPMIIATMYTDVSLYQYTPHDQQITRIPS